ncbi:peptidylprolyl isomerase [Fodinibius sediminis]|uniref:peptidylprolyl isomerase n=1 Tax=Fodinibius sediminis TaxID=1214077 RepID=A0A521DUL5_9BACT|nr:peptidylprolyl isomerase [Fodinibius sediminis]SMO74811.1 Peptidyl-prolyl cis-trans isomerase (rotamase)-cyclophilin family [Fodinibius sediminis]
MRYIRLRAWILFTAMVVLLILMFKWSSDDRAIFKSASTVSDPVITETYPDLYETIFQREATGLLPFLSHRSDSIRSQAWRALAATPVDSLAPFVELAGQQNSEAGWFAISKQGMGEQQLRNLERQWEQHPNQRAGIARVLGQQGDRRSLDFLLSALDTDIAGNSHYALALSRLLLRYEVREEVQIRILQKAFDLTEQAVRRAYLYGWYRGAKSPLEGAARDTLMSRWREQGMGISETLDQYVNRIFPGQTTYTITNFYNGEQDLEHEVQLAVELAMSVKKVNMNSRNSLAAKILLMHPNVQVQKQTLQSISSKISRGDDLYSYITKTIIPDTLGSQGVWLEALNTVSNIDTSVVEKHIARVNRLAENEPYLLPAAMELYRSVYSTEEYLQHIGEFIDQGEPLPAMYAVQSLADFWQGTDDEERTSEIVQQVRTLIFEALSLNDRGTTVQAAALLEEEELFNTDDFDRINRSLVAFSLPEDREVYQRFGSLYKERFEEQGRPVVDSLSVLGYRSLNRSLAADGWTIRSHGEIQSRFRVPDWERLWELGSKPSWTLRTEKGDIVIQLNTLKAPATVSAIDSLSRAGAYDGIPFHRVVPNFVIQGGDMERRDGFGGTGFRLPTEPSGTGFLRGTAGIASAGIDTEGGQYFIMHQWSPHLNGNYTSIGSVIDGMEVVERIEVGDKVLSTTWY